MDLTPGSTVIKYTDDTQAKLFGSTSGFTVTGIGSADSDNLLERNEVYKIELINLDIGLHATNDDTLATALGVNKTFTLEVIPTRGAVLLIFAGAQALSFGFVGTQLVLLRKEIYRVQKENLEVLSRLKAMPTLDK